MTSLKGHKARLFSSAILSFAALIVPVMASLSSSPAQAQYQEQATEDRDIVLGMNKGTLIRLDKAATNVFIANPNIADVQVKSSRLIYLFGTGEGETTFYAVDSEDNVLFSASITVALNIDRVSSLLKASLPQADIAVKSYNGLVLLTGWVDSPTESELAKSLAQDLVGTRQKVINQIQIQTPTQVNLQVKFAEVSRAMLKQLGFNHENLFTPGNGSFGFATGRDVVNLVETATSTVQTIDPITGAVATIAQPLLTPVFDTLVGGANTVVGGFTGNNISFNSAIDALESEGFASTLASPNLTALSGETATFLAGGEFPVPIPSEDGLAIEFREFGVGLSFTPTVLSNDRINLRVRPEVSELSQDGAIAIAGISVPALVTRRAETTVELGSGEGFAIAGLLQNTVTQNVSKLPGLGNLPVLGALFKSDSFQNQETELVMVVTPYLVKPVDPRKLVLPTDGLRKPDDVERYLRGETFKTRQSSAPSAPASGVGSQGSAGAGFSFDK